jgi:hypothetical protein
MRVWEGLVSGVEVAQHGTVIADYAQAIAGGIAIIAIAIGSYWKKPRANPGDDVAVVSATFADRATIQVLANKLEALTLALGETNALLKAEAAFRHDEATRADERRRMRQARTFD